MHIMSIAYEANYVQLTKPKLYLYVDSFCVDVEIVCSLKTIFLNIKLKFSHQNYYLAGFHCKHIQFCDTKLLHRVANI